MIFKVGHVKNDSIGDAPAEIELNSLEDLYALCEKEGHTVLLAHKRDTIYILDDLVYCDYYFDGDEYY